MTDDTKSEEILRHFNSSGTYKRMTVSTAVGFRVSELQLFIVHSTVYYFSSRVQDDVMISCSRGALFRRQS